MSIIVLFIKSFIIFIMMLSQGENVELEFHDYYVSTTQVDYIKKKNILQITIRMFINDFEDVITKNNNLKLGFLDITIINSATIVELKNLKY